MNRDKVTLPAFLAMPARTMVRLLLGLIRGYQLLLSPVMGTQCRFYPSCSHYAEDAIRVHGCGKGLLLCCGRILRCNPLCAGGYDPVPQLLPTSDKAEA